MKTRYFFITVVLVIQSVIVIPKPHRIVAVVLVPDAVDHGFQSPLVQTKDYKIVIRFLPAKHTVLRRKGIARLARNRHDVPEYSHIYTRALLFQ